MATNLNLTDIAVQTQASRLNGFEGYRWLDIRNAIKDAGHRGFSREEFIYEIVHPKIVKMAIKSAENLVASHKGKPDEDNYFVPAAKRLGRDWYEWTYEEAGRPQILVQLLGALVRKEAKTLRNKANIAFEMALKEGLIEPGDGLNVGKSRFTLTDRGRTFMAQKALKPITRERGLEILEEVIARAEAFNAADGPNWEVSKIYLFGSLLKGADNVNDIDIMVETRRRHPEMGYEEFIDLEYERFDELWPSTHPGLVPCTDKEAFTAIK